MREFPFEEVKITENKVIRIFDAHNTTNSELIWHKDREDREVYVEKSKDWHLQLENEVPVKLEAGQTHFIPAYTWHRLLMGKDKLIVEISKTPVDKKMAKYLKTHPYMEPHGLQENKEDYPEVRDALLNFFPEAEIIDIELIGSSALSPKEREAQDIEKYGFSRGDERDTDLLATIAGIDKDDAERWAFSEEAEELEMLYNFDVQVLPERLEEKFSKEERKKRAKKCDNPKGFTMKQFCKNQKTRSKKGERTNEGKDPKKGTGKKPKGSGRRLYTDENPKDTVSVKFSTVQDIKDTLSKASFKSKSHKRQSQIINLIHQRVRAAYRNAKDPEVKKRLKRAFDYAKKRKEASKRKTKRLRKEQTEPFQRAVKKGHQKMKIRLIGLGGGRNTPGTQRPSYKRSKSAPPGFGGSLEEAAKEK